MNLENICTHLISFHLIVLMKFIAWVKVRSSGLNERAIRINRKGKVNREISANTHTHTEESKR